jgi:lipopolysaccharide O-acetyltransferase
MKKNNYRTLVDFISVNGWYVLMLELTSRAASTIRSGIYSRCLGSRNFYIGERPYIRGIRYIAVGNNFSAGRNLWMEAIRNYGGITREPSIVIGDNVGLSDSVHIASRTKVVLGDGVLIGSGVLIIDHNHGIYKGKGQSDPESRPSARALSCGDEVHIGRNVWIGDGAVVLPGSCIGAGSIIGANSVVNCTIPPSCIAVGSPAHPIKIYDRDNAEWIQWRPTK